jgi:uncharacterized protein YraI
MLGSRPVRQDFLGEFTVSHRRAFITLALAAGISVAAVLPALAATQVQSKSVAGPNGRTGSVTRFSDNGTNSLALVANDADGPGGLCTETWVDYTTKPHEHWNPAVLVNCSGGVRSVSPVLTNNGRTINGMGVVVCEVPNTSGPITRNSSNCKGDRKDVWLRSGQSYSGFQTTAAQHPEGVRVYR